MENSSINKNLRTRNWSFIAYPESIVCDWNDVLNELHIKYIVSPLHDKDKLDDGSLKKAHWHFILIFNGKKSYKQINEITTKLNATIPQPVNDLQAYVRYLIHLDHKDKYQYDKSEILLGGGIDIEKYFKLSVDELLEIQMNIQRFICDNDIIEYSDLLEILIDYDKEWYKYASNHTMLFNNYLKSRRHRKK